MSKSGEKLSEAMTLVDRISDLPNSILCHILSFIPTKQVVEMSILSRRFEFLWTCVETLYFSNYNSKFGDEDPSKMQFAQFVHGILQLHRAPVIKSLRLRCHVRGCNKYDVVAWIRTVVFRNVESLDLDINFKFNWPLCLFYSQTLVELTLAYADITNMNIPAAPFFPNLKKLHLHRPIFEVGSFERFISGCSILEYLFLQYEHESEEVSCYISSTTLKTFSLSCNLSSGGYGKIVLHTPSLEFFKSNDIQNWELLVESSMPSMHQVSLSLNLCDVDDNSNTDSLLSCLDRLSNVVILQLEVSDFKRPVTWYLHDHFHNLTKLEIAVSIFDMNLLGNFLEKSNNLEAITLKRVKQYGSMFYHSKNYRLGEVRGIWDEPQNVPKCLMSSLTTICIKGYENEEEVNLMMKYVLRNAKLLESMEIHTTDTDTNEVKLKFKFHMLQKISMFRRASERCQISFF